MTKIVKFSVTREVGFAVGVVCGVHAALVAVWFGFLQKVILKFAIFNSKNAPARSSDSPAGVVVFRVST